MSANQNPEQAARDRIDAMLAESGWVVQDKKGFNFNVGLGIAVREYQTDIGPADYVLFVDKQAVGVIEAKKEELGHNITTVEDQTSDYANAKLKWIKDQKPLPFLYESTGVITRFTDGRDPASCELKFRLPPSSNLVERVPTYVPTCAFFSNKYLILKGLEARGVEPLS